MFNIIQNNHLLGCDLSFSVSSVWHPLDNFISKLKIPWLLLGWSRVINFCTEKSFYLQVKMLRRHIISQCFTEDSMQTKYVAIWLVPRQSFPIMKDLLTIWLKAWLGQRADGGPSGCRATAPGLASVWTSGVTSQKEKDLIDKKHFYKWTAVKIAYG